MSQQPRESLSAATLDDLKDLALTFDQCAQRGAQTPTPEEWAEWAMTLWQARDVLASAEKGERVGAALTVQDVESLAARFHEIYQQEAKRQGDVRHKDAYAELPENIKEFDRVIARYVMEFYLLRETVEDLEQEYRRGYGYAKQMGAYGDRLIEANMQLAFADRLKTVNARRVAAAPAGEQIEGRDK